MSYILDALKKLEQEKARKAKMPGSISIAGELFSENRPARRGNNGRKAALAILVAVAVTFGLTWYILKGKGGSAIVATAPQLSLKPAALPSAVLLSPVSSARAIPVPPVQSDAKQIQQSQQPGAPLAADKPSRRTAKKQSGAINSQASKKTRDPIDGKLSSAPADIQVNGVAWQDERGLRRAVVNGILLKEGASIAGAQLKEILPDRVRFERSGALFEVPFVSSSIPVGNK